MARAPAAGGVIVALLLSCGASATLADAGDGTTDTRWREAVLELRLNGIAAGEGVIALRDDAGGLWLGEQDLGRLRLRVPPGRPHVVQGQRYFPLAAIPGTSVTFDEAHSEALITAPASAFESSSLSLAGTPRPAMSRSGTGALLNYIAYGQRGQYRGSDVGSLYTELGAFSPLGALTNTAAASSGSGARTFVRLETTMSHDFPDSLQTLRVGDAISVPGSWAQAVRFAGLQWGTNYSIRPDLVTTPLLAARGTAVVPSTVDVFVNGKAVGSSNVPAGPFVVNQVPALTGSGDVRIVVRDVLGQQQVMTVPFYSSAVLLQPGLSLYDLDVGVVRENFGLSSADYGAPLATATWRRGLTSTLTGEFHAEALQGGPRAAGLNVARAIDHWLVVTGDVAVGGQRGVSGSYTAVGLEHLDAHVNLVLRAERSSEGFREVGDQSAGLQLRPRDRYVAQLGWSLGRAGNFAAALVDQRGFDDRRTRSVGLSYSAIVGPGSVSANLTRTVGDTRANSVYFFYTVPLGPARNTSTAVRYDTQAPSPGAALVQSVQKSLPAGPGDGYLVSWTHQSDALTVDAAVARYAGLSAQRLSVSGGATWLDGRLRSARTVRDSFAAVDVGGIPNMTVYFDNQPVARTDQDGVAVVRDLRSYDVNRLSIDAVQLPLDVTVAATEIQVVPAYRSGTVVRFPVKRERSGVFRLRRADGSAVPAGAVVRFQGHDVPVGLDGLTYVTDYDHGTSGEARWDDSQCTFRLPPPPPDQTQPDLGSIECRTLL